MTWRACFKWTGDQIKLQLKLAGKIESPILCLVRSGLFGKIHGIVRPTLSPSAGQRWFSSFSRI